jgi:hypothetical protein
MSRSVEFKFDIDDNVIVNKTGESGMVQMLGYDDAGPQYFIKLKACSQWWKEKHISGAPAEENTERG